MPLSYAVELGGGDQGVDGGGAPAAFVGTGEGAILSAHGDSTRLPLDSAANLNIHLHCPPLDGVARD
jgi:hypothetical protein